MRFDFAEGGAAEALRACTNPTGSSARLIVRASRSRSWPTISRAASLISLA
jgi:hypothetical protein